MTTLKQVYVGYLARRMVNHHLPGWGVSWMTDAHRLGVCRGGKRVISLSSSLLSRVTYTQIRNAILHEIAHGLVGRGHGHGEVWRNQAVAIGCDGCQRIQLRKIG